MGWLWSSASKQDDGGSGGGTADARPSTKPDWSLSDQQKGRIFNNIGTTQASSQSREAQADAELESFLKSLSHSEPQSTSQTPKEQAQPEQPVKHDRIKADGSLDISPHALYPRTMTCRHAFDQAFYCQSLGGKFNDVYRYGGIQSCSEQWGAFWFCMRTKSLSRPERERQIREHYAEREERRKKEYGSSENVWEIRDRPVERAFWKDPDEAGD